MERGEGGQGDGEERAERCGSIRDSIRIGHPSPGNSHHEPFVARAEMSAINSLVLNTEPIPLASIPECDACGAPSQNYNDLHPAPSLPTNGTEGGILEATDYNGSKYVLSGTVKYKNYANYQHRLTSFLKSFSSVKTAEELADAGFLYHSAPDRVVCFCCGIGLKEWEPEDQPLLVHAVKSPLCSYMQLKDFQMVMRINASAHALRTNSRSRLFQEERQLANVMERKIIQELTGMGYSPETIQQAISCVQRKGAEMNPEVVANTILDMDQTKTNRAESVCYLCQRGFRNGYTLCPCGHLAVCLKCKVYKVALCPLCGEKVERCVRTYPECQTKNP
ncbi:hypothetical protein ACJMK2_041182 [Sinanodonta woodiana]|uniref:RING-type domain-containing protein n=1 Tax=Sinanodonta woodiana TaxID=1069815 RepID=A0ABD3W3A4_SINWO